MTKREREVVSWLLDEIERIQGEAMKGKAMAPPRPGLPPESILAEAQVHVRSLRRLLGDVHSAESHAPPRRRRRPDAESGQAASPSAGTGTAPITAQRTSGGGGPWPGGGAQP